MKTGGIIFKELRKRTPTPKAYLTHSVFKVVLKKSTPYSSVNLSFTIADMKNKSTNLSGADVRKTTWKNFV